MLKYLDELSSNELIEVCKEVGLEGESNEAVCVIRLTMYLVKVGEDPFTFQFSIDQENEKEKRKTRMTRS